MSIYITKDGEKRKVNISATDVQLLDIDGRFKNKNLEDALKEVGGGTEENMTRIEEKVSEHTTQLKDVANEVSQISNLNLLINGDFKINQRSETTYTIIGTSKYTIDRWISYNLTSDTTEITTLDNGIKVKSKSGGSGRLRQWLEPDDTKKLVGKTVTFSIKVTEDCTQCIFTTIKNNNNLPGDTKVFANIKAGDILSHTFTVTSDYSQLGVQFSTRDTNGIIVEYAKLELGSKPTPFIPRQYGEELALCQRYYQNKFVGKAILQNVPHKLDIVSGFCSLSVPMRTKPTVKLKPNADLTKSVFGQHLYAVSFDSFKYYADQSSNHGIHFGFISSTPINQSGLLFGLANEILEADSELY